MNLLLTQGNAMNIPLADESVHCVVTSPPYWGLRDYGIGDQLGLEPTPEQYIENMVAVFREVKRVLRSDGTLWLNMGDSYNNTAGWFRNEGTSWHRDGRIGGSATKETVKHPVLKQKDLCGIPWRLAFALQADGWVLRSDVIWAKPNPMPESVTDRPTKSHEYLFMLSKGIWKGIDPGKFSHISNEDARWLALFFDTEGNITVKKVTRKSGNDWYGIQIGISSSNLPILEMARNIVGHGTILEREGTNAPMYYWQCSNQIARDLLYRLYPFFVIKQRQARLGIFLQDILAQKGKKRPKGRRTQEHTDLLERMWATNKELNSFGNPDISWIPEPKFGKWDSQPYFYDADAVREESKRAGDIPGGLEYSHGEFGVKPSWGNGPVPVNRNRRTVWHIATAPYSGAHFATYPPALVEPCIKAGTSERGVCPECGAPWERIIKRKGIDIGESANAPTDYKTFNEKNNEIELIKLGYGKRPSGTSGMGGGHKRQEWLNAHPKETLGWRPTCEHDAEPVSAVVFDPFAGSGTTLQVARALGRSGVGLDLSAEYLQLARQRLELDRLDAWAEGGKKDGKPIDDLPMFKEMG